MKKILIPPSATTYILYQRTRYLKNSFIKKILSMFEGNKIFYKLSKSLQALLFRNKIHREFVEDLENDIKILEPFLPKKINSVLDIGCGVGGIDIMLSNFYCHKINIHLLDKTRTDSNIYYGFEKKGSYYNSLEVAKETLENNGIMENKIHLWDTSNSNTLFNKNSFDIIISLLSWGFHYPITTYIDEAKKSLNSGGVLILDIRKNTGGEDQILKTFNNIKTVYNFDGHRRIIAIKE